MRRVVATGVIVVGKDHDAATGQHLPVLTAVLGPPLRTALAGRRDEAESREVVRIFLALDKKDGHVRSRCDGLVQTVEDPWTTPQSEMPVTTLLPPRAERLRLIADHLVEQVAVAIVVVVRRHFTLRRVIGKACQSAPHRSSRATSEALDEDVAVIG